MEDVLIAVVIMAVPITIVITVLNYSLKVKRMKIEESKDVKPVSSEISLSDQSIEVMQNLVDEIRSVRAGYQSVQDRLDRIERALDLNAISSDSGPESMPLPGRQQIS